MSRHHRDLMSSEPGAQKRWATIRERILARDRACQVCGVFGRSVRYEVHHLVPVSQGGDAWDEKNLQLVCRDCHFDIHGRPKRSPELQEWERYAAAGYPTDEADIAF